MMSLRSFQSRDIFRGALFEKMTLCQCKNQTNTEAPQCNVAVKVMIGRVAKLRDDDRP